MNFANDIFLFLRIREGASELSGRQGGRGELATGRKAS
jgi:hypothetical protein